VDWVGSRAAPRPHKGYGPGNPVSRDQRKQQRRKARRRCAEPDSQAPPTRRAFIVCMGARFRSWLIADGRLTHTLLCSVPCHPFTASPTDCSHSTAQGYTKTKLGMQAANFGSMVGEYSLPNQPMQGTVAQCAAKCTANEDCRGFTRHARASVTATAVCYLKSAVHPDETVSKGTWTTYIVRCNAGALLPLPCPWRKARAALSRRHGGV